MNLESLMLEFAQAVGGVSKHRGDFWVLEVPMEESENCVLFFRLNTFNTGSGKERILVFFTQISLYRKGASVESFLHFEHALRANLDLRFSRIALMGDRMVLLSTAHENFPEEILLEMVHEVLYAGTKLKKELNEF